MDEAINPGFLIESQVTDFPDLVSFWQFTEDAEAFSAQAGEAYTLQSQSGMMQVVDELDAPFAQKALQIQEGQWLSIPRAACPALDFHGPDGAFTVVAWFKRAKKSNNECEFIAGQWNESNKGRQYGLFLNIGVWQQHDQVTGHFSHVGGPTPGYKYCVDGPVGSTPVPWDEWQCVAMSYDGSQGFVWLNGQLDLRPGLNPYSMSGGMHDGGANGSDFTVAAVDRSGHIGNFFHGLLSGLAVYKRALTVGEIYALSQISSK